MNHHGRKNPIRRVWEEFWQLLRLEIGVRSGAIYSFADQWFRCTGCHRGGLHPEAFQVCQRSSSDVNLLDGAAAVLQRLFMALKHRVHPAPKRLAFL